VLSGRLHTALPSCARAIPIDADIAIILLALAVLILQTAGGVCQCGRPVELRRHWEWRRPVCPKPGHDETKVAAGIAPVFCAYKACLLSCETAMTCRGTIKIGYSLALILLNSCRVQHSCNGCACGSGICRGKPAIRFQRYLLEGDVCLQHDGAVHQGELVGHEGSGGQRVECLVLCSVKNSDQANDPGSV
jgi:hypothetical protein